MDISFPERSAYDMNAGGVGFPAIVDGIERRCVVQEEALMDLFGATTNVPAHLVETFEGNRFGIEPVAEERIRAGAVGTILLTPRDF